jgi:hypothetical protein
MDAPKNSSNIFITADGLITGAAGAALVQFVPSDVKMFPLVDGVAYVSVLATQFVPSDTMILRDVALADPGNVGVDHVGGAVAPDNNTLFAVPVPANIAPAVAVL